MIAVLLALLVAFAGCASPQNETEAGGQPAENETPTTVDNEAGAEPVNPPNETNGTESGGTVNPADGAESGTNGSNAPEAGANDSSADDASNETSGAEAGENETGANETGTNESGANETAVLAGPV